MRCMSWNSKAVIGAALLQLPNVELTELSLPDIIPRDQDGQETVQVEAAYRKQKISVVEISVEYFTLAF